MKRPMLIFMVAILTFGASFWFFYQDKNQKKAEPQFSQAAKESVFQAPEPENVQELLARAQSIAEDYQRNHPEAIANDKTLGKILKAVRSEAEEFEKARKEVEVASREVQALREQLNTAVLQNLDKEKITELNNRFEEKAIAFQQHQKLLEEAYLEVSKAYDRAIEEYL